MNRHVNALKNVLESRDPWLRWIALCCAGVAATCLLLALAVATRAVVKRDIPLGQPAALFAIGVVILAATRAMWDYARWGRNVAVVVVVCITWVMAEKISSLLGDWFFTMKAPIIVFGAVSLAYFTGPTGRYLFRKKDPEDQPQEALE